MPRYGTLVLSHTGALSPNSATLSIRKPRGKWLSQTLARSSGDFSVVLPALRNETTPLSICRPVASEL